MSRFLKNSPIIRLAVCLSLSLPYQQALAASSQNLPSLGDHTSGIISLEQERILGQGFLRSIRAQAPLLADPILQEYLEVLIYRLASHSHVQDKRLDLVIINNKTLNAFAAPGGIVGVNLGLFLFGETESEISAILTHELAHLSQRHFARGAEAGKKSGLVSIAGLLTGLILMATTGGEAGVAALSVSNSLAQNSRLKYSRGRETEADRLGIYTLAESDMNPRAMAHMFERLSRASRFNGRQLPEFLRTHPVTKNRISDSYAQTENLPIKNFPPSLNFQLMKARVQVLTANSSTNLVGLMRDKLNNPDKTMQTAARYGLALSQAKKGNFDQSLQNILQLQAQHPNKIIFIVAEAELHLETERYEEALAITKSALLVSPNNYPLTMTYAKAAMKAGQANEAVRVLTDITSDRTNDKDAWYLLAEAHGLDGNTIGVHQTRAEFFVLVGNFDQAIKQLGFGLPLVKDNFQQSARIQQRMGEIFQMKLAAEHN